jgi:hypothetical protein
MLLKSSIQTVRYCRSRAYGVFSTYSLRGYNKNNPRKVDREESFKGYLGREGESLQSFETDVDLWSPHLEALNPSLTLDFDGGDENRLGAVWGREGRRREWGRRPVKGEKQWKLIDRGENGYLYPKDPDTPGQVRSFRETRNLLEIFLEFLLPLNLGRGCARNLIWDRFGWLYM